MMTSFRSRAALALVTTLGLSACASAVQQSAAGNATPAPTQQQGRTKTANPADVHFMTGMVAHHAQAVKIASWAPSHGASPELQRLAERIVVGQRDEIGLMQQWLRDHGQPVPDSNATHMRMTMNGMAHDMLMPGMLNDQDLAALDRARGREFDRLFLKAMIKHHEGALVMVEELTAAPGAALDEVVFKFSSEVFADQTTEIVFMTKMLEAVPPG
jgi:uncharacterized protein (DUF305 family)